MPLRFERAGTGFQIIRSFALFEWNISIRGDTGVEAGISILGFPVRYSIHQRSVGCWRVGAGTSEGRDPAQDFIGRILPVGRAGCDSLVPGLDFNRLIWSNRVYLWVYGRLLGHWPETGDLGHVQRGYDDLPEPDFLRAWRKARVVSEV